MVWSTRPCIGSWLSRPPAPKHTHTLSARPSPGRNQCFLENGKLDYDQDMLRPFLFSWQSEQAGAPACALGLPPALTLSDGEDQVSFFPEALVQLWRPKEAMPESGESSPSNSWLDSFLGRKAQTITNLLSSRDSPPVSVGPGGGVRPQRQARLAPRFSTTCPGQFSALGLLDFFRTSY